MVSFASEQDVHEKGVQDSVFGLSCTMNIVENYLKLKR